MEARLLNSIVIIASICSMGASVRTANFIVDASTPKLATEICQAAEQYRKKLAIQWLGKELPRWVQPCPIKVTDGPNLGAGGATSFRFDKGDYFGWNMSIQGSRQRILDSVLPHEITHTIFATHFHAPVPRWADEGACTTVEHLSERTKQDRMLISFLKNERGIPIDRMFAMRDYPKDIMPLYSQGYSLSRMLIAQTGKQGFIKFVGSGMKSNNWPLAVKKHYGYNNMRELQDRWVAWVRQGSPLPLPNNVKAKNPILLASTKTSATKTVPRVSKSRPSGNLIYRGKNAKTASKRTDQMRDLVGLRQSVDPNALSTGVKTPTAKNTSTGWYSRNRSRQLPSQTTSNQQQIARTKAASSSDSQAQGNSTQQLVTRPQPIQKSRQVILQWNRDQSPPGSTTQPFYQSQQIPAAPKRRY